MTTTVRTGQVTRFAELPETLIDELREMAEAGLTASEPRDAADHHPLPLTSALKRIFRARLYAQ